MSVNYFGYGTKQSDDIDNIVDEIEYRIVSDKLSKLTDPVGNRIIESTEGGDIKEGEFSLDELEEKIENTKDTLDVLEVNKLSKFDSSTSLNRVVVTAANGGVTHLNINPQLIDIRLDTLERARQVLETTKLTKLDENTPEGKLIVTDADGGIKNIDTDPETLDVRIQSVETALTILNSRINTTVKNYINLTAELRGAISSGDIFNYGSFQQVTPNWHGGYIVMKTGSVIEGSLSCVSNTGTTLKRCKVTLYKNGMPLNSTYKLILTRGQSKIVKTFDPPLPVQAGDFIFFMADSNVSNAVWTVASILMEVSHE